MDLQSDLTPHWSASRRENSFRGCNYCRLSGRLGPGLRGCPGWVFRSYMPLSCTSSSSRTPLKGSMNLHRAFVYHRICKNQLIDNIPNSKESDIKFNSNSSSIRLHPFNIPSNDLQENFQEYIAAPILSESVHYGSDPIYEVPNDQADLASIGVTPAIELNLIPDPYPCPEPSVGPLSAPSFIPELDQHMPSSPVPLRPAPLAISCPNTFAPGFSSPVASFCAQDEGPNFQPTTASTPIVDWVVIGPVATPPVPFPISVAGVEPSRGPFVTLTFLTLIALKGLALLTLFFDRLSLGASLYHLWLTLLLSSSRRTHYHLLVLRRSALRLLRSLRTPCTYCEKPFKTQKGLNSKLVSIHSYGTKNREGFLHPIRASTRQPSITDFISVGSPEIIEISIGGRTSRRRSWPRTPGNSSKTKQHQTTDWPTKSSSSAAGPSSSAPSTDEPLTKGSDPVEASKLQKLFRANQKTVLQSILSGPPRYCQILPAIVEDHFRLVFSESPTIQLSNF
ncbi:hypothetical protein NPIL_367321 [Nephila pilipes]|uniref:Uncharacterized protein n=1 Tax=Nephila pilipes TaxID=299642 RepID=A0A8X6T8E7_NEPPI|nr:hypothetical protein NPIL_367321 [Nephila pilipes]